MTEKLLPPQPESTNQIVENKVVGSLKASQIPDSYGIVTNQSAEREAILTNDVGDAWLFANPTLSDLSSIEITVMHWDTQAFLRYFDDVAADIQEELNDLDFPNEYLVTKSEEGTEILMASGQGSLDQPYQVLQSTLNLYQDDSVFHLALSRTAYLQKKPVYGVLDQMLFQYLPLGDHIMVTATVTASLPRKYADIAQDVLDDQTINEVDYQYFEMNRQTASVQTPLEWSRQMLKAQLETAQSTFEQVKRRLAQLKD